MNDYKKISVCNQCQYKIRKKNTYKDWDQGKQPGWSGFGWTTISQGKNKIPFYKKEVINKSIRVIFGLIQVVICDWI